MSTAIRIFIPLRFLFPRELSKEERQGRYMAAIVTTIIATAILLLILFWKIVTPIPAIPPPTDMPTVEIGFLDGSGGDAVTQGGGSVGNSGTPGMQTPSNDVQPKPASPSDGSVTDPNSANAAANNAHNPVAAPSDDLAAALANWKKNKSAATINIGGDGKGDPYTGGMGNGSGIDHGPGTGDPGTGTPGGNNGNSPGGSGKRYRHILFSPEIVNPTQEEGKVVVNVYVDRKGNVTRVENGNGSTTLNSTLVATAKQSAYKIKFDEDATGPELLILPVDINFTLK